MKAFTLILFLLGVIPVAAGLEFETPLVKVEAGLNEKSVTRDFKFKNTGDKAVKIKGADGGCSCMGVEISGGKVSYAAGEEGAIRVVFELGSFQGTVDKQISVWLEGDPEEKPSTILTMSVHIPVIISLEPKTLKWELGGTLEAKVIDVMMDYGKPIRITSVSTSNESFTARIITVEEGKHYQVEVTPAKGARAAGLSIVRIETDVDVEKQRVQQGFALISAPPKAPK